MRVGYRDGRLADGRAPAKAGGIWGGLEVYQLPLATVMLHMNHSPQRRVGTTKVLGRLAECPADPSWLAHVSRGSLRVTDLGCWNDEDSALFYGSPILQQAIPG